MDKPDKHKPSKSKEEENSVDRRSFIKAAAASGAALAAGTQSLSAQVSGATAATAAAAEVEIVSDGQHGSDFMMDVLKQFDFEFMTINTHSDSAGLQESVINYTGNKNPELITCLHEEVAVAMAHGYYKIEGKPLATLIYGSVGLQHAAMAVYSAFCDRVPAFIMLGNQRNNPNSRSVQDAPAMVRDFTKWDDSPLTLNHFAQSAVRAYSVAMTPPTMPVVLSVDKSLQEMIIPKGEKLRIPKYSPNTPPAGDSNAVRELAKMLVNAELPVLAVERAARTEAGLGYIIELAELLQAGVVDSIMRMNFPSRHPLQQEGSILRQADVVLALEHPTLSRTSLKEGAKLLSISGFDLFTRSNYWHFGRYTEPDLAIAADAEATLPALIEEVKRQIPRSKRSAIRARGVKLAEMNKNNRQRDKEFAANGWNSSPLNTARVAAELWEQIKHKDWSLVSRSDGMSDWAWKLWDFNKYYHHIGQSGSTGVGYSNPAAVGAALANRKHGRLSINLQNDGDFMFLPSTLWTAAHHKIPMLTVMHNNRAYNQEVMLISRMAAQRNRDVSRCTIGSVIDNPNIDFAQMARSMGWYAEGPIEHPADLAPAIKRAIAAVESGQPALLDTVTHPN
jgi:acetolactate synthase-1/2/3 large subunit